MKIKYLLLIAVLFSAVSCFSISSGDNKITASENHIARSVELADSFIGIDVNSGIDVLYTQSSDESVAIEVYAPENIVEFIGVEVKGGLLKIDYNKPININKKGRAKIEVRVSAPALSEFHSAGSSEIKLQNGITNQGNLKFRVKSSGEIEAGVITCAQLYIDVSGSGDLSFERVDCTEASIQTSASGDVEIDRLNCTDFNAQASSSGSIEVDMLICENARTQSTSAAEISLVGQCNNAVLNAASSGQINAYDFVIQRAELIVNSAGSIKCNVVSELLSDKNSMIGVIFRGQPKVTHKE